MALSVLLRQGFRVQGSALPSLLKNSLCKGVSTKNYTQIFSQANKNALMVNKSIANLVKPVQRNMSADHSKLWPIEKLVSVVLLGVVPAAFLTPNPILDNILAAAIVIHFHWGLEACIADYARPIILGPVLPKLAILLLYVVSATTLGGLLYFNHNDIGIGQAVRKLWAIKQ